MGQMAEGMEGEKETMIRDADLHDLDGLVDIERRSFLTERISRRSFRHLLTRGNARLLVDAEDGNIRAYSLLLFQRGTPLARLYSFAVAPEYRGLGVAKALLAAIRAANLVGDGLYGVDLKETAEGVFVIEINDNPNIDRGIEDAVLGDALYETVLRSFIRRIELPERAR